MRTPLPMPTALAELIARGRRAADESHLPATECVDCRGPIAYPAIICDPCTVHRARTERVEAALRSVPQDLRWASFGTPLLKARVASPDAYRLAQTAANTSPRVLLFGRAGTGKSALAVAMLRARLERSPDLRCLFVPAWRLGSARSRSEDASPELVNRALRADLVVLDDLGQERDLPSNALPDVVFERFADGKATWITTWMDPAAVNRRYGDGMVRRVFTRTAIVECSPLPALEGAT